ncbi:MAG: hypothetical protein HYY93_12565 [Planctomycetes bacterium]|nr:hypothetical protein [Planctomycetota bacterium]
MGLPAVGQLKVVTLLTTNLAKARDFYVNRLGLVLYEDRPPEFFQVRSGGTQLCFDVALPGGVPPEEPRIIFQSSDLPRLYAAVKTDGLPLKHDLRGDAGRRWFSVLDPDGHEIIFAENA